MENEAPRIINTYDQNAAAGGDRIVIFRNAKVSGRGYRSASWQVARYENGEARVTDWKAPWYDYGKKTFSLSGFDRKSEEPLGEYRNRILQEAIAWITEKYGPREFVKNRSGDYVEKEVNEKFPIPLRKD